MVLWQHVEVTLIVLSVFMWNLCKCNCWLIIEVILRNARCNNKVYSDLYDLYS